MKQTNEKVIPLIERKRCPSHPGEVLKEFYLDELKITRSAFARDLGVSRKAISLIINSHKSVTAEMSLRISKATETNPQLWLNLQTNYDLWQAANNSKNLLDNIKPIAAMV